MNAIEKAYIAGIIDGEGCLTTCMNFSKGYGFIATQLVIGNTDFALLKWLQRTTGVGSISEQKRQNHKWKRSWRWSVSGRQARTILRGVFPFLQTKRRQAALFIELVDLKEKSVPQNGHGGLVYKRSRPQAIFKAIRRLNRKGAFKR